MTGLVISSAWGLQEGTVLGSNSTGRTHSEDPGLYWIGWWDGQCKSLEKVARDGKMSVREPKGNKSTKAS